MARKEQTMRHERRGWKSALMAAPAVTERLPPASARAWRGSTRRKPWASSPRLASWCATRSALRAATCTLGTPERVLVAEDEGCTAVTQLVSIGDGLLVGLWDRNGQRLLQLERE